MEIKIGVQDTVREVALDSNDTSEEVIAAVEAALASGAVLKLIDERGRTVMVPGTEDRLRRGRREHQGPGRLRLLASSPPASQPGRV